MIIHVSSSTECYQVQSYQNLFRGAKFNGSEGEVTLNGALVRIFV